MTSRTTQKASKLVEEVDGEHALLPSLVAEDANVHAKIPPRMARSKPKIFILCCIAAGLSLLYVVGGVVISQLGMDWGYYLVKAFFGQVEGDAQCWGALFLGSLIAPIIYAAMSIALSKQVLGGKRVWHFVLLVPLLCGAYAVVANVDSSDQLYMASVVGGLWLFLVLCYRAFGWILAELWKRTRALRLLLCPVVIMAPIAALALLDLFSSEGSGDSTAALILSMAKYTAVLFGSALLIPLALRTRDRTAAAAASIFAFMPTLLFSMANIAYASLCLHNWHAAASALFIMFATAAATVGGAIIGCAFPRRTA